MIAVAFGLAALAAGPSFDCAKASTQVEHQICGDAELSALDVRLAASWKRALAAIPEKKDALKASQLAWIARRDRCAPACVRAEVEERIGWLDTIPGRPRGSDTNRTGHYEDGINSVDLIHRDDGSIEFVLSAFWQGANPDNVHMGFAGGTIKLEGTKAVYKQDACTLTFTFVRDTLAVAQEGADVDCGFGANVYAGGNYARKDRLPPLMDPAEF